MCIFSIFPSTYTILLFYHFPFVLHVNCIALKTDNKPKCMLTNFGSLKNQNKCQIKYRILQLCN